MNASAEEISSTIQQISKGASTQSERLTEVAKEVEKLSSSIKQIDSLGRMTTVSSQKSIEASKNGAQKTSEIVGKMAEIYQSSTWATQQVQGLQLKSKEIGKVINLISNIAQQTDFLALNAAIEAARAGEAGKGFSVVADEIRTLAVEAGNSAQQVTALIRDIEQEITRTVEGITQSQQIIETSKSAVDQTEQSLKVINSTVAVAGTMVKQMAEASRHQSESAGHVVTLASEVSTISIETASSTQEVAAAVEEQTASMEELSALSQTLSQTAETCRRWSSASGATRSPDMQLLTFQIGRHLLALPAAQVLSVGREGQAPGGAAAGDTVDLSAILGVETAGLERPPGDPLQPIGPHHRAEGGSHPGAGELR